MRVRAEQTFTGIGATVIAQEYDRLMLGAGWTMERMRTAPGFGSVNAVHSKEAPAAQPPDRPGTAYGPLEVWLVDTVQKLWHAEQSRMLQSDAEIYAAQARANVFASATRRGRSKLAGLAMSDAEPKSEHWDVNPAGSAHVCTPECNRVEPWPLSARTTHEDGSHEPDETTAKAAGRSLAEVNDMLRRAHGDQFYRPGDERTQEWRDRR
jgi:hypothetical protein